jgi:hypothetical protein
MKPAAVESTAAMDFAAVEAFCASDGTVVNVSMGVSATNIAAAIAPTRPPIPSRSTTPEGRWVSPVIPRAGADEHTTYEVLRPIEAIRSAGIGIIVVVSPLADRGPCRNVARPNPDADSDSNLRL